MDEDSKAERRIAQHTFKSASAFRVGLCCLRNIDAAIDNIENSSKATCRISGRRVYSKRLVLSNSGACSYDILANSFLFFS